MNNYQYEAVATELHDEEETKYNPLFRQLLISVPTWIAVVTVGFSFGATTVLIPQVRREANSTEAITKEMASWLSSAFAYSALPIIVIICSIMPIVGRKKIFMIVSLNTFIYNLLQYFSTNTIHILISVILQGINYGANNTLVIVLLSEYTSPKYRGILLTFKSASFYWGVWCANAIGTFFHWKNIPLTSMVLSLFNLATFLWPESPHWLASKGRFIECAQSYFWLNGKNKTTKKELKHMMDSQKEYIKNRKSFTKSRIVEIITSKSFYKPTCLCITIAIYYSFNGKIVCAMYAIDIIKQITGSESAAYYGMLLLDGVTVAGMYCGSFLSKVVKRRTLLMTMGVLSEIFLGVLALYLYLINLGLIIENRYASACLLVGFSVTVSMGPVILLISIHAEIMPMKYKSFCLFISAIINKATAGIVLKISPYTFVKLGMHGSFFFYGLISGLCLGLLYFFLPETKDRTLQEIEDIFEDKKL